MSDNGHGPSGFERSDAHAGATLRAGGYILAAMFVVAALLVPAYWFLVRRETKAQPRPATVIKETPVPGAFPRLVTNEPASLAVFRAQEDVILEGYAWVEKDRGIARMPISEAMRIVGARGALPAFPSPAPSPAASGVVSTPGGTR